MKSIKQYILEEFNTYRIRDVRAEYKVRADVNSSTVVFEMPENNTEDDFQIYLQDKYFEDFPASSKNAEKFFGENAKNIYDVTFEYDRYDKSMTGSDYAIKWDSEEDKGEDDKISYVRIENLKYVITFDTFDFKDEDDNNINDVLTTLFRRAESNETNKYELNIKFNDKNITYTED